MKCALRYLKHYINFVVVIVRNKLVEVRAQIVDDLTVRGKRNTSMCYDFVSNK